MRVRDVMSVGVVAADPKMSVADAAKRMLIDRIGALPVVREGRLVGIVTRADILPYEQAGDGRTRTVADIMTREVVSVAEWMSVSEAARVLMRNRIKRAPVLRDGAIIGMVGEADLLRPYMRTDSEIRADIEEALSLRAVGIGRDQVNVTVEGGVVTIAGVLRGLDQRALLLRLVRAVEGVTDVHDRSTIAREAIRPA